MHVCVCACACAPTTPCWCLPPDDWGDCSSGGRAGCPMTERLAAQIPLHLCVTVSLGKTLNPHCLVRMWVNFRWWSEGPFGLQISCHASKSLPQGSCGYTCSLPPPVWMHNGFNVKRFGCLKSAILIQSMIIIKNIQDVRWQKLLPHPALLWATSPL